MRQYFLREGANVGDLQVNLVDKHHRDRQSHAIAVRQGQRGGHQVDIALGQHRLGLGNAGTRQHLHLWQLPGQHIGNQPADQPRAIDHQHARAVIDQVFECLGLHDQPSSRRF